MPKLTEDEQIQIVRNFLKANGCEVVDLIKRVSGILSELNSIQFKLDFLRSSLITKEERLKSLEEIDKIIHGDELCAE